MPKGLWPPFDGPQDDSYSWWVRSHCGHDGGARQWAFYDERSADQVAEAFVSNPCLLTRCPEFMIKNVGR